MFSLIKVWLKLGLHVISHRKIHVWLKEKQHILNNFFVFCSLKKRLKSKIECGMKKYVFLFLGVIAQPYLILFTCIHSTNTDLGKIMAYYSEINVLFLLADF